jgi:hypothetical protein
MKEIKSELEKIILHGVVVDIFIAERAYSMLKIIDENIYTLNERKDIVNFFHCTQAAFKDQFLIAISRIFDKHTKNKTRCIFSLLAFIEKNISKLPPIEERENLIITMSHFNFPEKIIDLVQQNANESKINLQIIEYFNDQLTHREPRLLELRKIRDKRLAHNDIKEGNNELQEKLHTITFTDLYCLVELAKQMVSIIGWAYMNTVFFHDGKYILSDKATAPIEAFTNLLKQHVRS